MKRAGRRLALVAQTLPWLCVALAAVPLAVQAQQPGAPATVLPSAAGKAPAAEAAIEVIATRGRVEAVREALGQTPGRRALAAGSVLTPGDLVVTDEASSAQLRFRDGALVSVGSRTQFRIDAYAFGVEEQRGLFALLKGSIKQVSGLLGKRDPADYRLTTPTASIGIRGTEFVVIQRDCAGECGPGAQDALQVGVREGRVAVENGAGQASVEPGDTAHVAAAGQPPRLGRGVPQFDSAGLGWRPLPPLPARAAAPRAAAPRAAARNPAVRRPLRDEAGPIRSARAGRRAVEPAPATRLLAGSSNVDRLPPLPVVRVPLDQRPPMPGWIPLPPLPEPYQPQCFLDMSLPHNGSAVRVVRRATALSHARAN